MSRAEADLDQSRKHLATARRESRRVALSPVHANVMKAARYVFEPKGLSVRLQPRPNQAGTEIYQLHTRPSAIGQLHEGEWKLVQEGPLERILKSLQVDYGARI